MPTFRGQINSELPHVGTTIFTETSRLTQEHNAVKPSQGFPDFDCTQELRDLFSKAVNSGLNQYPPMAGIPVLVFYNNPRQKKVLRFCFAESDETLRRGAEILCGV